MLWLGRCKHYLFPLNILARLSINTKTSSTKKKLRTGDSVINSNIPITRSPYLNC